MENKLVVANGHGPVPMIENSRRYITDKPVLVPMNSYYLRRIAHGELVEADPEPVETDAQVMKVPLAKLASKQAASVNEPVTSAPMPFDLGKDK